ncbi:MAG TPA: hypothetical protein VF614_13435 [Chthoniobacteraceae bacterium]|jgi:hypothetical protein
MSGLPPSVPYSRLFVLACACAGLAVAQEDTAREKDILEPYRTFIVEAQRRVAEFPLLPVGTTAGKAEAFSVPINENPIVVGEHRFGCVRFVAPKESPRDMVWAFSVPAEWAQWFILPASGSMTGFTNWLNADRLYAGLPATIENPARLQTLSAASLKAGETYVLWFKEQRAMTEPAILTGVINFLPPPRKEKKEKKEAKEWDAEAIEKGLGLKAAPAAQQAAYFKSRGGKALLDSRFFRPKYAAGRIDDLLLAVRSSKSFPSGMFVEMRISIPPCETDPPLAGVEKAYGPADIVLSAQERQLFDKDAPADEVAHYYDHFAFLVSEKAGQSHILQVTAQAPNTSEVRPQQDGLTWSDMPMNDIDLRVFYRDRKEIARVAFWGVKKAQLLSGKVPVDTFTRGTKADELREELKHLGTGSWEYRSTYPDGQPYRNAALQEHAYHGVIRDFYANGKPKAEATYTKGELDGVLKQWSKSGESRERRYRQGELVVEGEESSPPAE